MDIIMRFIEHNYYSNVFNLFASLGRLYVPIDLSSYQMSILLFSRILFEFTIYKLLFSSPVYCHSGFILRYTSSVTLVLLLTK